MTSSIGTIHVRVALQADMRKYVRPGEANPRDIELRAETTVGSLLATLGVPPDEIVTVGLNGILAHRETLLHDADEITMFSPMEGG
jgi:sulfur carrier protein ThiS